MKKLTLPAGRDSIQHFSDFIEKNLIAAGAEIRDLFKINIAIDEILNNIVTHGYKNKIGAITVEMDFLEDPWAVEITFIDSAGRFNLLDAELPDITLPADERDAGGLGILIVRKTMDEITYTRADGLNILRIVKNLEDTRGDDR